MIPLRKITLEGISLLDDGCACDEACLLEREEERPDLSERDRLDVYGELEESLHEEDADVLSYRRDELELLEGTRSLSGCNDGYWGASGGLSHISLLVSTLTTSAKGTRMAC